MKARIATLKIEEADTPLRRCRAQLDGECDADNRDTACLSPVLRGCAVSMKNVMPNASEFPDEKPRKIICESSRGCERLGMAVLTLEAAPFTTKVTGNSETKLKE